MILSAVYDQPPQPGPGGGAAAGGRGEAGVRSVGGLGRLGAVRGGSGRVWPDQEQGVQGRARQDRGGHPHLRPRLLQQEGQ